MATNESPTLNYDAAAKLMVDRVFAPVFFSKLASYGFQPADQEEADALLALANQVGHTENLGLTKQANTRRTLIERASQRVNAVLGQPSDASDREIDEEATKLAGDALFRDSALLYQDGISRLLAQ